MLNLRSGQVKKYRDPMPQFASIFNMNFNQEWYIFLFVRTVLEETHVLPVDVRAKWHIKNGMFARHHFKIMLVLVLNTKRTKCYYTAERKTYQTGDFYIHYWRGI